MKNTEKLETQQIDNAKKTFLTGENFYLQHLLGAHREEQGYIFRVWAPNALAVFLVGDFNDWQDWAMEKDHDTGIWQIHCEEANEGDLYNLKSNKPMAVRF